MKSSYRFWPVIVIFLTSCSKNLFEFQPNINNGGRIVALDKDPYNDNKIIAAAPTGGIFISTSKGSSWTHINLPVFEMVDVKFCPTNSNIVIATSTRDLKVNNGGGIWRSTDGGNTWSKPPTSVYVKTGVNTPSHGYGISFEPGQSSRVYVGTEYGVAISNDDGATWTYNTIYPYYQIKVYDVLAGKNGLAIAATSNGIYRTTNGGVNWSYVTSILATASTRSLCYSTLNNNNVFIAADGYKIFYSGDFGATWKEINSPGGKNREPFIRFTSQPSHVLGVPVNISYLYYGNGVDFYRKIIPNADNNNGNVFFDNGWVQLSEDHSDPSDIIFDNAGNSLLLSGDGGVFNTSGVGSTWHYTGGGSHGLNALQINEAAAQENLQNGKKDYIYFGTQDNQLWTSLDGGGTWNSYGNEGHSIQVKRRAILSQGNLMTFALDDSVGQYYCNQGYTNVGDWQEVAVRAGDPVSVQEGDILDPNPRDRFIQLSFTKGGYIGNRLITLDRYYFRNTLNGGGNWNTIGVMTYAPTAQYPKISNDGEPTVYQPYFAGSSTKNGFDKIGLVKLSQTNRTTMGLLENADANGFGSLGIFTTEFKWYNVFAVNPTNPDNAMIADIENSTINITNDGGKNWYPNYRLTELINNNGSINFYETIDCCPKILVTCISYNPDNTSQIAIGTRENGIFFTWDGGNVWYKLDNTTQITNVSSIVFYFDGNILVSTYGRGLWKFKPVKSTTSTLLFPYYSQVYRGAKLIDFISGKASILGNPHKAGIGSGDRLLATIRDTSLTIPKIISQGIQSINALPVNMDTLIPQREMIKLNFPESTIIGDILKKLAGENLTASIVRAVIYNNQNQVTGLIVSIDPYKIFRPGELTMKDNTNPYINILDDSLNAVTALNSGNPFYIKGVNFIPGETKPNAPVQIYIDGTLYKDSVPVSPDGSFLIQVTAGISGRRGVSIMVNQIDPNKPIKIIKTIALQREFENIQNSNDRVPGTK